MKSFLFFCLCFISFGSFGQIIVFPDANFKNTLVNTKCVDVNGDDIGDEDVDTDNDGEVSMEEALAVNTLILLGNNINALTGLEHFSNLLNFRCINNPLFLLDLTQLVLLEKIYCVSIFNLSDLKISGLTGLKNLSLYSTNINQLKVQDLSNLDSLILVQNKLLDTIQFSETSKLSYFEARDNSKLKGIDLANQTKLKELHIASNKLIKSIDINSLVELETLIIEGNSGLKEMYINGLNKLKNIDCNTNGITKLAITNLSSLDTLMAKANQLSEMYLSNLAQLSYLDVAVNKLETLSITDLPNLETFQCNLNRLNSLSLDNLPNLKYLVCNDNHLTSIDFGNLDALESIDCTYNMLSNLNLTNLVLLLELNCGYNQLASLDILSNPTLSLLECSSNLITNIQFGDKPRLKYLNCSLNQLDQIDLSYLDSLEYLNLSINTLTNLSIQNLELLKTISIESNRLQSILLENLPNVEELFCEHNQLTTLDVNQLYGLKQLSCFDNKLIYLELKNGSFDGTNGIDFSQNKDLTYICCDDDEIDFIFAKVLTLGYSGLSINTYCSFNPGGVFSNLKGKVRFDNNKNGCDTFDLNFPYLKFSIASLDESFYAISYFNGTYDFPLSPGVYSISPILESNEYFEINPSNYLIEVPTNSDTFLQDFCIVPIALKRQIDITIIPITVAVPGFDVTYKIVYENRGNQIENGILNFTYNESMMDFISADVFPNVISDGILSWHFSDLVPFERREIFVTLKLNSPSSTSPVNAGDFLYFNASILDNIFTLEVNVLSSFDPNDKTCLQGQHVKQNMIGDYLDYLIRFENTGTYKATNIVVKDLIDTNAFDLSSLQITDASHPVYTRIKSNKVEFIFEDINLPFDDANNDGYIAFQLKTKSTLVLGDSLKNTADIYFDYNLPIRTNEAQTTIFDPTSIYELNDAITVYPNPVSDILNLDLHYIPNKVEIYDELGRIIKIIYDEKQHLNVQDLVNGTYILRVYTNDGVFGGKFVKM